MESAPNAGLTLEAGYQGTQICKLVEQLRESRLLTNLPLVTRENLENYASLFNIDSTNKTNDQLATEIVKNAPCEWIYNVLEWAKINDIRVHYLNLFRTDRMLGILYKIVEAEQLDNEETEIIINVNNTIYASPRPNSQFKVYRGLFSVTADSLNKDQIITFNSPKSGTFSFETAAGGYINYDINPPCCILEILIPKHAIITYHPQEDQVIFPTGAQFCVLSSSFLKNYMLDGQSQTFNSYQLVYINAPNNNASNSIRPSSISSATRSIHSNLSLSDAYLTAFREDLSFPYGNDPYTLLANKNYSTKYDKMDQESTLDLLNRLFDTDPRLRRTKPTKEYHIDLNKLEKWKSLADSNLVEHMRYVEYHFKDWMASLAYAIDILLEAMTGSNCDFMISNGKIESANEEEQSASELWMNYIFNSIMTAKGYIIETYDNYWNRIRRPDGKSQCFSLVFLDDFVRTGMHMSFRILATPGLQTFLIDPDTNVYIVAPIIVTPDVFRSNFEAIVSDSIYGNDTPEQRRYIEILVNGFTKRIHLLTGIVYDIDNYPYIVLDHTGSDKFESEISRGHIGMRNGVPEFLGSLLEGADPSSPYRYPPPLYHLEFGNGKLPLITKTGYE